MDIMSVLDPADFNNGNITKLKYVLHAKSYERLKSVN